EDPHDPPKRRRIRRHKSKKKFKNPNNVHVEQAELEKEQSRLQEKLQPQHTDGPTMSKNKKRKLKKKQQIKRKTAAGLLAKPAPAVDFMYQPEGGCEPAAEAGAAGEGAGAAGEGAAAAAQSILSFLRSTQEAYFYAVPVGVPWGRAWGPRPGQSCGAARRPLELLPAPRRGNFQTEGSSEASVQLHLWRTREIVVLQVAIPCIVAPAPGIGPGFQQEGRLRASLPGEPRTRRSQAQRRPQRGLRVWAPAKRPGTADAALGPWVLPTMGSPASLGSPGQQRQGPGGLCSPALCSAPSPRPETLYDEKRSVGEEERPVEETLARWVLPRCPRPWRTLHWEGVLQGPAHRGVAAGLAVQQGEVRGVCAAAACAARIKPAESCPLCLGDSADADPAVSMETTERLLGHLETHGLAPSDLLLLDHMQTLLLSGDVAGLRGALEAFPERCALPPGAFTPPRGLLSRAAGAGWSHGRAWARGVPGACWRANVVLWGRAGPWAAGPAGPGIREEGAACGLAGVGGPRRWTPRAAPGSPTRSLVGAPLTVFVSDKFGFREVFFRTAKSRFYC
ncbi:Glutamate-rich protein 1, partial [Galemys pyrenaicus]